MKHCCPPKGMASRILGQRGIMAAAHRWALASRKQGSEERLDTSICVRDCLKWLLGGLCLIMGYTLRVSIVKSCGGSIARAKF